MVIFLSIVFLFLVIKAIFNYLNLIYKQEIDTRTVISFILLLILISLAIYQLSDDKFYILLGVLVYLYFLFSYLQIGISNDGFTTNNIAKIILWEDVKKVEVENNEKIFTLKINDGSTTSIQKYKISDFDDITQFLMKHLDSKLFI